MKPKRLVQELEAVARQLGVEVRYERGGFRGGRCTVDGEEIIMLNRRQPPEMHVGILTESLRGLPVDTVYLKPAVRAALEARWDTPAEADLTDAD